MNQAKAFWWGAMGLLAMLQVAACSRSPPEEAPAPADPADGRLVRLLGWPDYFPADLLQRFERETGIHVALDVTDGNASIEARLLVGHSGYDLVIPSGSFLSRQIAAGVYQPLDKTRIPNLANLDPVAVRQVEAYDPGMRYSVPYAETTYGLALDLEKVRARLGPDAPLDTWRVIFDPANAAKLADCGIFMYDSPHYLTMVAYLATGVDPASESQADLARVEATLRAVRPYIRKIDSSTGVNDLADRAHCAMIVNSSDLKVARDRVREAGGVFGYDFVVPREGATYAFDMLAVPVDAPNPAGAHALIDFLLRPDEVAAVVNFLGVPIPVPAARPLVRVELQDDPLVFPSRETQALQYLDRMPGADTVRARARAWTRFVADEYP